MSDEEICMTCRYARTVADSMAYAACHRYAPRVGDRVGKRGLNEVCSEYDFEDAQTYWPIVTLADWCGEWASRDDHTHGQATERRESGAGGE
jgi:hypothetical protein